MAQPSLLSHFNNLKPLRPGFAIHLPEGASLGHHTTVRHVCLIPAMPRITNFTRRNPRTPLKWPDPLESSIQTTLALT